MDSKRKYLDLVCSVCQDEYKQQERVHKKSVWKDRCPKHRFDKKTRTPEIKKNKCTDCGTLICRGSNRCKKCNGKQQRTRNYNNKCIDCDCGINSKSKRCVKCNNINQNKGLSTERTLFNNSKEWNILRNKAFKRDNHTCKICNERGSKILNGHHIKSYKNHKKDRLNIENIITLCIDCHMKLHHDKDFKNKNKKLICD